MTPADKLNFTNISRALANYRPEILTPDNRQGHAAVALLLREGPLSPEALFIIRAEHDQDPWSGNIAFPGGRLNPGGESPQQAAERETFEELSLDLGRAQYLGRINDLYGATLPVLVSCFVYQLLEPARLQPNHEVAEAFWCPLTKLMEPERQQQRTFFYSGAEHTHPVVELLDPHQPLLWGITYRLICSFFESCALGFNSPEPTESTSFRT